MRMTQMEDLQDIVNALLMREPGPATEEHPIATDGQEQPDALQEPGAVPSGPLTEQDGVHETRH
jgi:hypothetical protein